jgi:hypothetical protein
MRLRSLALSPMPWLVLALLFGVLPLGLSSTEMWDGVVGVHALKTGDWTTLKEWLLDSNWYLTYGLFILADRLHQVFGLEYWIFFKLWILLMIVGSAFEAANLAQRIFEVPDSIAAWVPALVFSFPIWYVFFSFTPMLGHLTCLWLALTGYRLSYSDKRITQATGMLLVAMSFQLASNCAFILSLELGRWALTKNKSRWSYGRSTALLVLSVAVFAATRFIWPPVGMYVGYNRLLNPLQLSSWISYAKYSALFATWLVLLAPMLAGAWWTFSRRDVPAPIGGTQTWSLLKQQSMVIVVFALLLLAACAPYIAVGLGSPLFTVDVGASTWVSAVLASHSALGPVAIWFGNWSARHLLLMMIPLVLLIGWLASLTYQQRPSPGREIPLGILVSFVLTIVFFLAIGVSGHWAKLQRIAKEQTVVHLLASKPQLPDGQVDLQLDKHEDFLGSVYEANHLLYRAYNSTHWLALMYPNLPVVRAWGDERRRTALAASPANRASLGRLNMMADYSWSTTCKTVANITFPHLSVWDVLWQTEHAPSKLPVAQIEPVSSNCPNADKFWQAR